MFGKSYWHLIDSTHLFWGILVVVFCSCQKSELNHPSNSPKILQIQNKLHSGHIQDTMLPDFLRVNIFSKDTIYFDLDRYPIRDYINAFYLNPKFAKHVVTDSVLYYLGFEDTASDNLVVFDTVVMEGKCKLVLLYLDSEAKYYSLDLFVLMTDKNKKYRMPLAFFSGDNYSWEAVKSKMIAKSVIYSRHVEFDDSQTDNHSFRLKIVNSKTRIQPWGNLITQVLDSTEYTTDDTLNSESFFNDF